MELLKSWMIHPSRWIEDTLPYRGRKQILEEQLKLFLDSNESQRVLYYGRRMLKSFGFKLDIAHKCFWYRNTYALICTPRDDQAKEFIETFKDEVLYQHDLLNDMVVKDNNYEVYFENPSVLGTWSRIKASVLPDEAQAGKKLAGRGVSDLYFEECQDMNRDGMGFVLPTIIGQNIEGRNKTINYNGTVRWTTDWYLHFVTESADRGMGFTLTYPTCEVDGNYNVSISNSPRITIEELEQQKSIMGLPLFLANYCLIPMDKSDGIFAVWIPNICIAENEFNIAKNIIVAGLDIGFEINNSVLTLGYIDDKGMLWVFYCYVFPLKTSFESIMDYIINLKRIYPRFQWISIDETGSGSKVVSDANRILTNAGISLVGNVARMKSSKAGNIQHNLGVKVSRAWKEDVIKGMISDFQSDLIRILNHQRLISELNSFTWEDLERKPTGASSPDCFDSLMLLMNCYWEINPYHAGADSGQHFNKFELETPKLDKAVKPKKRKDSLGQDIFSKDELGYQRMIRI